MTSGTPVTATVVFAVALAAWSRASRPGRSTARFGRGIDEPNHVPMSRRGRTGQGSLPGARIRHRTRCDGGTP